MIKTSLLLAVFTVIISSSLYSQEQKHEHEHEHEHKHPKNEIGIVNAPVYFLEGKEFAYGLHVHYLRTISESKFGLGLGYERIFDEHGHNTFALVMSYRPIERLSLALSPGLAFEDEELDLHFALHFETTYEFEIDHFHFGPVIGIAYDPEDIHLSLGLHLAYGF